MIDKIAPYWKAVIGGLAAGLTFAIPVIDDGLSRADALGILLAVLTGSGLVYAAPKNRPARDERGAVDGWGVVLILILVGVIALLFGFGPHSR